MLGRRALFVPAVLAATTAPYFFASDGWKARVKDRVQSVFSGGSDPAQPWRPGDAGDLDAASVSASALSSNDPGGPAAEPKPELAGPPVADLREVLRFDISPQWVTQRWSRVSTAVASLDLQAMRVPLVTGVRTDDLAGSLTYYFDQQGRVQRIAFEGYTGDERRLVAVATQYFGLQPRPVLGAGLYLAQWNGKPTSALRIRRAPVVSAGAPHSRLLVMLEVNRPAAGYGLSGEFQQLLASDLRGPRW